MASTAVKMLTILRPKGSYLSTILGTAPIALWPLSETSGTSAADATGNGYTGTYSNVTLNNATFGDGTAAPLFVPASSSHVATYSAGLNTAVNKQEGTLACWLKVSAAGVWEDGQSRWVYEPFVDASNRIRINKNTPANTMTYEHRGGGTPRALNTAYSPVPTGWFHVALTWSTTVSLVQAYYQGAPFGTIVGAPGTYAGTVSNVSMAIGTFLTSSAAANRWDGYIKYMALWSRALTPAEVASLYVSSFAV